MKSTIQRAHAELTATASVVQKFTAQEYIVLSEAQHTHTQCTGITDSFVKDRLCTIFYRKTSDHMDTTKAYLTKLQLPLLSFPY